MTRPPRSDLTTAPSVALIGSFRRHYRQVLAVAEAFAAAGFTVTTPPPAPLRDSDRNFVLFESDSPHSSDHHIQAATLEKIFSSDFVYVVDPDGYVGPTTAYELGHAHQRGMAVYFAEPPADLPIEVPDSMVAGPDDLVLSVLGKADSIKPVRRPRVAALPSVDIVIFTIRERQLQTLLIKRGKPPFRGASALPGGFVRPGESLEETAERELKEETNLRGSFRLEQVHTFSHPGRDPRGRVITTAFLAVAPDLSEVEVASDADRADWVEVDESMWRRPGRLAFDHGDILRHALEHARRLLEHTTIAAEFCPRRFTISDLRRVYEVIWGVKVNPQNFQRKVREVKGFVVPTRELRDGRPGRPAELFRRGSATILDPPMLRPRVRRAG